MVDLLGDPNQQGSWKRRGLVIGDVQSGKTATYIGIVNKAADAGYKLVVLLTGATESLRQQTQYRVDEGFLGKDSSVVKHDKIIGVGKYPTQSKFLRGQGMTTHAKDFVTATFTGQAVNIDPNADHPYVFVVKKNTKPLENIISWLQGPVRRRASSTSRCWSSTTNPTMRLSIRTTRRPGTRARQRSTRRSGTPRADDAIFVHGVHGNAVRQRVHRSQVVRRGP